MAEWESRRCECGGDITETTAAENEFAYEVETPTYCRKCQVLAAATERAHKEPKDGGYHHPSALRWHVKHRPDWQSEPEG